MNPVERAKSLPPVTVLMPVHNGERYLSTAIESVLAQTHDDFEFLILDDGSTDGTQRTLARYAAADDRIRIVRQRNRDQPVTLNRGLELARHEWIAILDHDDVCEPERLKRQLEVLAREPMARVIGTWAVEIDSEGRTIGRRAIGPTTTESFLEMRATGRRVPLVHPSVLMHGPTILELGGYDPLFGPAADTELWTRVAHDHVIVVVPEPLIRYRIHRQSMSFERLFEQRAMLRLIMARDDARRRSEPIPTLEEFQADRPLWSARRWSDIKHDLFWYLRSHCLLSASEGSRISAAAFAVCAAAASPSNALRLIQRHARARGAPSR